MSDSHLSILPDRRELGDFLRSRRRRLSPEALGLAGGRRRRTPGLRREEVAELAGIGIDWYVRLEQGRTVTPSVATVDALSRALRLDETERAHLRTLALRAGRRPFSPQSVPGGLGRLVASLPQPAYVTGRRWDVLAWNDAAATTFTDFGRLAEADRNVLVWVLTDPAVRRLFGTTWEGEARRMVGQFRATHDLAADDPALAALLARLAAGCAEFRTWWDAHDVRRRVSGRKLLEHPTMGRLRLEYSTFRAGDDPDLRLVVYNRV